jgi:membrane peptidoglycan carboxypeptidase
VSTISDEPRTALLHRGVLVLVVSVLSGVLLAGALFPLIGGIGLAARAGADGFVKLPAALENEELPLPQRSRILAADGSELATVFFNENRIVVPLAQIPEVMQRAIIAIEDRRFYQHGGVDFRGLARAVVKNQREGEVTQGGSTLTQQYVKNVLIERAADDEGRKRATERSTSRKLREARYALALEKRYTKQEILEKYLNIAYFGQGVYGVGTAALHYFGKDLRIPAQAKALTVDEAALLAGLVKNPTRDDPVKSPKNATARRNVVLDTMLEQAFITPAEHRAARARKLTLVKSTQVNDCGRTVAPFFCAYVRDAIIADDRFTGGASKTERIARLYQGGLTIRTTLDRKIQAAAQSAVTSVLPVSFADRAAAVATVVEPGTGHVKAIASNQTFGEGKGQTQVNHALGGSTGMQPGSTYKTFFLAAAVKQGIPLGLILPSPRSYASRQFTNNGKPYQVSNYGGSAFGSADLARATWNSINTYYLQLAERTGLTEPNRLAERMGLTQFPLGRNPASVLGTSSVSPLQLTEAYATLAARGIHCDAIGISEIRDATGALVFSHDPTTTCERVLDREDADTVNAVLQGVITNGTARNAAIGRPAAGKTGTSQSNATAWFQGYTPQLSAGIYMGHPKQPVKFPLKGIPGAPRGVTGGSLPSQMWQRLMKPAHAGLPLASFAKPPARATTGDTVVVPDVRGTSPEDALTVLREAGLFGVLAPNRVSGTGIPAGLVGATSPGAGASSVAGGTVAVYLSDGSLPPPPTPTPTATPRPSATVSPSASPSQTPRPTSSPASPTAAPSGSPSPRSSKSPKSSASPG